MSDINSDSKKNKNGLTLTRIFDAPKELVWKAWTDPE
ncbi:MAG: SRPBCC domain-containing protein, partial [Melioribacteraceae bacterium]